MIYMKSVVIKNYQKDQMKQWNLETKICGSFRFARQE
jgi:hypothetical protein